MTLTSDEFLKDGYLIQPPVKRAAYSDRMALTMAWMSKLAYIKFENPGASEHARNRYLDNIVERLSTDGSEKNIRKVMADLLENPPDPSGYHSWDGLAAELQKAKFELVNTYSLNNHQAFLAKRPLKLGNPSQEEGVVVLSFRGTESKNIRDWKIDLKVTKDIIDGNVPVHSGYWQSFRGIGKLLTRDLYPLLKEGYTLYITGHSMGGAMAMMATHEIGLDSAGACYTFGAPRVAGYGFAKDIKTPIYRVVNANDVVPRLPPVFLPHLLQFTLALSPIPWKTPLERLLERFRGYVHHGDMRYLRRANQRSDGEFDEIQLLLNPNMVHRFRWFIMGFLRNRRSPIDDHDIDLYCAKLKKYALQRRRDRS